MKVFIFLLATTLFLQDDSVITFNKKFDGDLEYFGVSGDNIKLIKASISKKLSEEFPNGGTVKVKGMKYSVDKIKYIQKVTFGIEFKLSAGSTKRYEVRYSGDGESQKTFALTEIIK